MVSMIRLARSEACLCSLDLLTIDSASLILNYCFIALSGKTSDNLHHVRLRNDFLAGLVLYEYIITISDEIQLFWDRRPTTWSFFLFTSNRLIMIGLVVTGALTVAPADRVTVCVSDSL